MNGLPSATRHASFFRKGAATDCPAGQPVALDLPISGY